MSRKQPKRRAGNMVFTAIAGIFIVAIVGGVGFGVASADTSDDVASVGAFGFDTATHNATSPTPRDVQQPVQDGRIFDQSALAHTSTRTLAAGVKMIDDREEAEAEARRKHIEAENAAIQDRVAKQKAKQGCGSPQYYEGLTEYGLPAVDWSVGMEAFLEEWTARIDAYLAGSPLEGYGSVFAEAAWDNGVDPRWSPAISNTESSKGSICFLPHNAWGWGESSFDDWESAIRAHAKGLATVYGYSITEHAAAVYCPPNHVNWYADTLSEMGRI